MVTQNTKCSYCKMGNQVPSGNKSNVLHSNIIFSISSSIQVRFLNRTRRGAALNLYHHFCASTAVSIYHGSHLPYLTTSGVFQSQLKVYFSVGLHDKIFARNSELMAHNYRRNISTGVDTLAFK